MDIRRIQETQRLQSLKGGPREVEASTTFSALMQEKRDHKGYERLQQKLASSKNTDNCSPRARRSNISKAIKKNQGLLKRCPRPIATTRREARLQPPWSDEDL